MEKRESPPVNVLLRGDESGGQLALIEFMVAAGDYGPPLHVHPLHGEGFYVLQGEVTVQVQGEMLTGGPGTFAFAAPGVAHTFANRTEREARLLVLCTPAGFDAYFEQMAADYARGRWPSPARPDPADAIPVGPSIPASGQRTE
jgi:quercetin dioxygenase-like cupin family protein